MGEEIANWNAVFDLLRLTAEQRDRIFYGTAARIFAVDEFDGVTDEASFDAIWSEDEAKPVDPDAGGTELAPLEDEPDAGGSVMESFRV